MLDASRQPGGRRARTVLCLAALLCLPPAEARAYIDPGTGSYVLQTLLAALFTAAILLRTFWARLTGLFRRRKPEERTDRTAGE